MWDHCQQWEMHSWWPPMLQYVEWFQLFHSQNIFIVPLLCTCKLILNGGHNMSSASLSSFYLVRFFEFCISWILSHLFLTLVIDWRNMEVKFNASCSGYVYVYSQGNKSAVSFEGWNRTEGETLCRDLKCGNFISGHGENTRVPFWDKTFSCGSQKPKNIWDCEKALSSSKQPQQQQLYINCDGNVYFCRIAVKWS